MPQLVSWPVQAKGTMTVLADLIRRTSLAVTASGRATVLAIGERVDACLTTNQATLTFTVKGDIRDVTTATTRMTARHPE